MHSSRNLYLKKEDLKQFKTRFSNTTKYWPYSVYVHRLRAVNKQQGTCVGSGGCPVLELCYHGNRIPLKADCHGNCLRTTASGVILWNLSNDFESNASTCHINYMCTRGGVYIISGCSVADIRPRKTNLKLHVDKNVSLWSWSTECSLTT